MYVDYAHEDGFIKWSPEIYREIGCHFLEKRFHEVILYRDNLLLYVRGQSIELFRWTYGKTNATPSFERTIMATFIALFVHEVNVFAVEDRLHLQQI